MITKKTWDNLQAEFDCSPESQKLWEDHYCVFDLNYINSHSEKTKIIMKECVAKFVTQVNNERDWDEGKSVNDIALSTVYDPNPDTENGRFFAATPSGNININTVNPDAAAVFGQPGDEILCTFRNLTAEKREASADEENKDA